MANGWTPERRARQSELIRTWRPWNKSTGPKTPQGKSIVSRNAYTGAEWRTLRELRKQANQMLRDQRHSLERFI